MTTVEVKLKGSDNTIAEVIVNGVNNNLQRGEVRLCYDNTDQKMQICFKDSNKKITPFLKFDRWLIDADGTGTLRAPNDYAELKTWLHANVIQTAA